MMTLPPLKYARSYAPSVVVQEGNKEVLYLFGGSGDNFLLSSVEMFVIICNLKYHIQKNTFINNIFITDGILQPTNGPKVFR